MVAVTWLRSISQRSLTTSRLSLPSLDILTRERRLSTWPLKPAPTVSSSAHLVSRFNFPLRTLVIRSTSGLARAEALILGDLLLGIAPRLVSLLVLGTAFSTSGVQELLWSVRRLSKPILKRLNNEFGQVKSHLNHIQVDQTHPVSC